MIMVERMTHPAIEKIERAAQQRNPGKNVRVTHLENVDPRLLDAYLSGRRVKVARTYHNGAVETRTGTVSVSLGWHPILLLMHRSDQRGSSDTLDSSDRVVAVQYRREYVDVAQVNA